MNALFLLAIVLAPAQQAPTQAPGQAPAVAPSPPIGREAILALPIPPLLFDPPEAEEHEVAGVPVYHLYDPTLPLVDLFIEIEGGISHFPRSALGIHSALPTLLRSGGTRDLPPDSVDLQIDLLALQLSFAGGGATIGVALNALTPTLDEGLALLGDLLLEPGFDSAALEVWRGQQLEGVRRREDDPQGLAISEFNRLLFGDHPTGWVPVAEDFAVERVSVSALQAAHTDLFCRERLTVGIAGDLTWQEAEPRIEALLAPWPTCTESLPELPVAQLRDEPGVFILPREVEQSTVVMAQPGGILLADTPEYFASRIADYILGSGGFSSRIMTRVRSEEGLAYGASSLWSATRQSEGILGALTSTRPERTIAATRLLLEIMEEFRGVPPEVEEVATALEEIGNGYVFAFGSPGQIVSRRMSNRILELPANWLERYLEGLQGVTPTAVAEVTGRYLDPSRMTILIVGDPERFDPGLAELGPLYELSTDGSYRPWAPSVPPPAGP